MPGIYTIAESHKARLIARERRAASALTRAYASVYARTQEAIARLTAEMTATQARGETVSSA